MNLERIRELNQQHYFETRPGRGFYQLDFGDEESPLHIREAIMQRAQAAGFIVDDAGRAWDIIS